MIVLNTLLNGNTICDFLLNPVDPVMCPELEFQSGFNVVRWICPNADPNTNPVETDPYYYPQPVGTECQPSHM